MKTIYLLCVLLAAPVWAQEITQLPSPKPEAAATPRPMLGLLIEVPELSFALQDKNLNKDSDFQPNQGINWGIEASYDGYQLEATVPTPPEGDTVPKKGKTNHFDLMLGHYWDSFGVDAYYQSYRGFYSSDGQSSSDENTTYPVRPDVHSEFVGANFYYAFAPERFPLQSLNADTTDTRHGGSFVAMASLNQFDIAGDSALIQGNSLQSARLRTLTAAGGYGYRWVHKNHSLNGQALIGGGPQDQLLSRGGQTERHLRFSEQLTLSASYAYHIEAWQMGVSMLYNQVQGSLGDNDTLEAKSQNIKFFGSRTF